MCLSCTCCFSEGHAVEALAKFQGKTLNQAREEAQMHSPYHPVRTAGVHAHTEGKSVSAISAKKENQDIMSENLTVAQQHFLGRNSVLVLV